MYCGDSDLSPDATLNTGSSVSTMDSSLLRQMLPPEGTEWWLPPQRPNGQHPDLRVFGFLWPTIMNYYYFKRLGLRCITVNFGIESPNEADLHVHLTYRNLLSSFHVP